jgi:SAM-dependent methyltransferase
MGTARMLQPHDNYRKRNFWSTENLNYAKPHFRLEKAARIVNKIARRRPFELLDVGCGPATLSKFLRPNIDYYGIDMAIHTPAPNFIEVDFVENRIRFGSKKFDIVVAQGVFEYVGTHQAEKFAEIKDLLKENGVFLASYVNFDHLRRNIYPMYNNIQTPEQFHRSLKRFFTVDRFFPTSHYWHHEEPARPWAKRVQMALSLNLPVVSNLFAIEYFFVCS